MHEIRENKRNKRLCKRIAALLTVTLLVNQSGFSVLAEETGGDVACYCDTRCSADSINEACPVCAEDYGKCECAEDMTDTVTDEESENSSANENVNTDADTNYTVLDAEADDESEYIIPNDDGESIIEEDVIEFDAEDAINLASVGNVFIDGTLTYKIIDEATQRVEVTGYKNGSSAEGALVIPPAASDGTNEYTVVSIGELAFANCSSLESITIPDDENFGWKRPVKSRVSAILSCDLLQIYYKFATHNTE